MSMDPVEMPIGESMEVEPGVVVERRCALKTIAVLLASVAIPEVAPIRSYASESPTFSLEEFIRDAVPPPG